MSHLGRFGQRVYAGMLGNAVEAAQGAESAAAGNMCGACAEHTQYLPLHECLQCGSCAWHDLGADFLRALSFNTLGHLKSSRAHNIANLPPASVSGERAGAFWATSGKSPFTTQQACRAAAEALVRPV